MAKTVDVTLRIYDVADDVYTADLADEVRDVVVDRAAGRTRTLTESKLLGSNPDIHGVGVVLS